MIEFPTYESPSNQGELGKWNSRYLGRREEYQTYKVGNRSEGFAVFRVYFSDLDLNTCATEHLKAVARSLRDPASIPEIRFRQLISKESLKGDLNIMSGLLNIRESNVWQEEMIKRIFEP